MWVSISLKAFLVESYNSMFWLCYDFNHSFKAIDGCWVIKQRNDIVKTWWHTRLSRLSKTASKKSQSLKTFSNPVTLQYGNQMQWTMWHSLCQNFYPSNEMLQDWPLHLPMINLKRLMKSAFSSSEFHWRRLVSLYEFSYLRKETVVPLILSEVTIVIMFNAGTCAENFCQIIRM